MISCVDFQQPTVKRLCFYIVYMLHFIKPTSVKSYLSGICADLNPFYPDVHSIRASKLINHTLAGCTKLYGSPAKRKRVLTESNLLLIIRSAPHCASHDDLLFMAITLVGWHCLLCLGELVNHDSTSLYDFHKSFNYLSVKFLEVTQTGGIMIDPHTRSAEHTSELQSHR